MYEDIFKGLEPERAAIIERCIKELNGKSEKEIISIVTKAAKEFNASGRPMTKEEQTALIKVMRENIPQEHRKKFDMILNMMKIKL